MPVAVVTADMTGHPPLHGRTEPHVGRRLYDEVEMIGHEAEAKELDGVFGFRRGKQVEKCGVVALLMEDRRIAVATIEHMVGMSGYLFARNTRHGRSVAGQRGTGRQERVACPLFFSSLYCLEGGAGLGLIPRTMIQRCGLGMAAYLKELMI